MRARRAFDGACRLAAFVFVVCALLIAPAAGAAEVGRVVSVGGSVTEIVFALGAGGRLVAVDSTSQYPSETRALPNVGYMRQLSAEPILALQPTLVLAEADAGPAVALAQLREAGVKVLAVPDAPTTDGVRAKIALVAESLGLGAVGNALADKVGRRFEALSATIGKVGRRPKVLFLLTIGRGAPLAGGAGTSADGIIRLAGGENAAAAIEGFKPITPEAAIAAAPDVILLAERTLEALGGRAGALARPEIAGTPAGRQGRLVAMDGLFLLGFGPRTPEAALALARALHPDLPLPADWRD